MEIYKYYTWIKHTLELLEPQRVLKLIQKVQNSVKLFKSRKSQIYEIRWILSKKLMGTQKIKID